jgi:hypothetical protein
MLANYISRPGFKTSEFLVSVLTVVGAIVSATQSYISNPTGVKLSVGAGLAYVISRGLAKYETTAPAPPPKPPAA